MFTGNCFVMAVAAVCGLLCVPGARGQAFHYSDGFTPVAFTYTCGGSSQYCQNSFRVPSGKLLVVQHVSGFLRLGSGESNPQLYVLTQIGSSGSAKLRNEIGAVTDQSGTSEWDFNTNVTYYTISTPEVVWEDDSYGLVTMNGYLMDK